MDELDTHNTNTKDVSVVLYTPMSIAIKGPSAHPIAPVSAHTPTCASTTAPKSAMPPLPVSCGSALRSSSAHGGSYDVESARRGPLPSPRKLPEPSWRQEQVPWGDG
jgi:hypothetical protein